MLNFWALCEDENKQSIQTVYLNSNHIARIFVTTDSKTKYMYVSDLWIKLYHVFFSFLGFGWQILDFTWVKKNFNSSQTNQFQNMEKFHKSTGCYLGRLAFVSKFHYSDRWLSDHPHCNSCRSPENQLCRVHCTWSFWRTSSLLVLDTLLENISQNAWKCCRNAVCYQNLVLGAHKTTWTGKQLYWYKIRLVNTQKAYHGHHTQEKPSFYLCYKWEHSHAIL